MSPRAAHRVVWQAASVCLGYPDGDVAARAGRVRAAFDPALEALPNLGVLAVLVVIGGITKPDQFLDTKNLQLVLTQSSVIGVVTVGATFVIMSGGIDLSVGAIVALASVWATTVATPEDVAGLVERLRDAVRGWLDAHPDAPAALRRMVVEQLADTERALAAQAADA